MTAIQSRSNGTVIICVAAGDSHIMSVAGAGAHKG